MTDRVLRAAAAVGAILALAVGTVGCGAGRTVDPVPTARPVSIADRFGKPAAAIQGCDDELSIRHRNPDPMYPGAPGSDLVICGPPSVATGVLVAVARYPSPAAADAAATKLGRRRLLCVVDEFVSESWIGPYFEPDEARAYRTAHRWALDYCRRVGGRSVGHWRRWYFSYPRDPSLDRDLGFG